LPEFKCPKCGSTYLAVEVKTWCNYEDNKPYEFDVEDVPYVEPIEHGSRICRDCTYKWEES